MPWRAEHVSARASSGILSIPAHMALADVDMRGARWGQ
jgi:hypothetical protein